MQNFLKKYLSGLFFFALVLAIGTLLNQVPNSPNIPIQTATIFDPASLPADAKPASGFAWNDNVGWINFGDESSSPTGRVYVSNNKLYGYAWGENIGWISMTCENDTDCTEDYGVTQTDSNGILTGKAWGENIGWIDFAPNGGGVTLSTNCSGTNTLSGSAWGENIGWISFNDSGDAGVTTTWNKSCGGGNNTPSCVYDEPVWGNCSATSSLQYRTLTASNQVCLGEDPKIEEQTCIVIVATTTPIDISISPATSTIFVNEQIQFTADVTGTSSMGVNWTIIPIEEDGYYGTITDTGLYTAPSTINQLISLDLQIIAKSQADVSKMATATVTVNRIPVCTEHTYSVWGKCSDKGIRTRDIATSTPANCALGIVATTTESCTPDETDIPCVSYTYSDWSTCKDGTQTRTAMTSEPAICSGGAKQITEQSCKISNTNDGNHSSSTGQEEDNVVPLLNVSSILTDNIAVLGTTTEKIILGAQKVLESPTGDVVAKTITTVGVVGGGVAVSSAIAMNGAAAADIFFMPFKLWGLLLSILGLKKRNRPWGTVYDSVTKQPIDPAYVMLKNLKTGKEEMSITDLDGRYGFLVSKGHYILSANKTNYLFPSKRLAGKTADALYSNLYFGEKLDISDPSVLLSKNIPLDPLKFDWNEFTKGQKKLMKFYSKKEKIVRIITDWLFRIGFLVSLISLFLVSAPYNLIIFGLYLVIYSLRKIGLRQKALGSLIDKKGNPLSFAIVRVFDAELKVEITNKVANKIGRYYCLVNKGKYYIKVEKKSGDESYEEVFTSPVFEAKEGIVNQSFII